MKNAEGTFEITSMGEDAYETSEDGAKLTRANGTQQFAGDIKGEGSVEWLMSYRPEGSARFLGMQRIVGMLGDREGSFLVEAVGDFDGSSSKGSWTVIEGSGTGDLAGLKGDGGFEASSGPNAVYFLNYELG